MSLGYAEARLTLFGRLMNGQIPADQEGQILVNISSAAAEIRAAMQLIEEPFRTEWNQSPQGINNVLNQLDRFAELTEGQNCIQRAANIDGTRQMLRSILSVTFMSARGDALRSEGNCDRFIMDAYYNFGKATIAANLDNRVSLEYQGGALGSMRLAINEELAIAMDRDGHLPFDGHRKKECCTFGTPAQWAAFQAFNPASLIDVFRQRTEDLLGIIGNAVLLDPSCTGDAGNPWDRAADDGDKSNEEKERHTKELVDALIARGENLLSRCSFAELQQILNQLAALAPGDPRHQSLRARSAQFLQREQEGLNLLREAGSYSDLDRTVDILKQAQQKFPCPKPEVHQVISSIITEAADQRRGVDLDRSRARRTAWTSVLGGIIQGMEQVAGTQSGGGTFGTGEAGNVPAGTAQARPSKCVCENLNYGRYTNHAVRGPQDVRCPPIGEARLTKADLRTGLQPSFFFDCGYEPAPEIGRFNVRLGAEWCATTMIRAGTSSFEYIHSSRNAAVSYSLRNYQTLPPSFCQSLCRAAWDLLRQVEPLGASTKPR